MNIETFSQAYIEKLNNATSSIDIKVVKEIIEVLDNSIKNKSRIYIMGNGGSASTASHIVSDLGVGLRRRGIVNIDITSLSDNIASTSAIANDIGYDNIFYMQLKGLLKPSDVIIAISCSGNSANIIKVANYAKTIGSKVIGFSGFDGGKLKKISDISLHVDTKQGEYGLVENTHLAINHIIYFYYLDKSFQN